jgi:hypothetical protein
VHKAVSLSGVDCHTGVYLGRYYFKEKIADTMYLNMQPAIHQLYGNEPFYFQQDGAPPGYHTDIRSYLNGTLPGQWIGRRGSVEYHLTIT